MSGKRPSRAPAAAAAASSSSSSSPSIDTQASVALAYEIRAAKEADAPGDVEERSKYIKRKLDAMDEDQLTRFEFFIRSHFSRGSIKDILSKALGPNHAVTDEMAIVCSGLAKLVVGELIAIASDVKKEEDQGTSSIKPENIEEAFRRMQRNGQIGQGAANLNMFHPASMIHNPAEMLAFDRRLGIDDDNDDDNDNEQQVHSEDD